MLDIDILSTHDKWPAAIFYRYRTGCLRHAIIDRFVKTSSEAGLYVSEVADDELQRMWGGSGLFPSARLCELPGQGSARRTFLRLKMNFEDEPNEPALIIQKAARYNKGRHPGILVVDEPIVSEANIGKVVRFACESSNLTGVSPLAGDEALLRYFRAWIRSQQKADLLQTLNEFDRVILQYSDPKDGRLDLLPIFKPESARRAFLAHAVGRFMDDPNASERANVIQALSFRAARSGAKTASDNLLSVSVNAVHVRCLASRRGGTRLIASREAAILFSLLILVYSEQAVEDETAGGRESNWISIHHALILYSQRSRWLCADPLVGFWDKIRARLEVRRSPRACVQLGGLCMRTDQNQTRNAVLFCSAAGTLGIPKSVVE